MSAKLGDIWDLFNCEILIKDDSTTTIYIYIDLKDYFAEINKTLL